MFHPDWFLRSPALRSVAGFITGARYYYYAAMSASWWSRIRAVLKECHNLKGTHDRSAHLVAYSLLRQRARLRLVYYEFG